MTGGIWQSGISKSLVEYVHRPVWFVNVQSSLHENVVCSLCARMGNAASIIFIMWNSIPGLDTWCYFRFNISCGLAEKVRNHQQKMSGNFSRGGEGANFFFVFIFEVIFIFEFVFIF